MGGAGPALQSLFACFLSSSKNAPKNDSESDLFRSSAQIKRPFTSPFTSSDPKTPLLISSIRHTSNGPPKPPDRLRRLGTRLRSAISPDLLLEEAMGGAEGRGGRPHFLSGPCLETHKVG